ncbi:hypothetical protein [Methylocaldum gracile]|jgi:hypothetical protein|uniref:hypothetical protein n=1 Tax=Methylocaldum sp. 0917 TaxID=2485163 RepID=UPI00105EDD95
MAIRRLFLVRRTPSHTVVAHTVIRETQEGQRMFLLRITPDSGPMPDVSNLIGKPYAARRDLWADIKARMLELSLI